MPAYRSVLVRVPILLALLTGLACGIGAPAATPTPESTPTPVPTPTPESKAVTSLQDVKSATIQIEAQGSFVDPEVGLQLNAAGTGSGFIIDESGVAVTNNHVVTGAALLKVWVGGESEPRNARILGVSECSDLAVIDIEGDGYAYLEWYDGPISIGLDVYAAGFPLGDPEFTLTRGIVSKEKANGETGWASVGAVIEHDATINPGNSGGPLVTEDAKVVGVNYASDPNFNQYFAIAREESLAVIEHLRDGQDLDSIGVNGTAVNDGEGFSGIWVASVKSGSPADDAGVEPGDIITKIEEFILAADGTMADYCDILRSHSPDDTLRVEVLRFDTQEVLEGQLNGQPLELSFSFAQTLDAEVGSGEEPAGYANFATITDDSDAIAIEVPEEWDDITGLPWDWGEAKDIIGVSIVASSNIQDFYDTYSTPGVFFGASEVLAQQYDVADLIDEITFTGDCTYEGRFDFQDPLYTGLYDLYSDCGGVGSALINLSAVPEDKSFIMLLQVMVVNDADLDALDRILDTFQVVGDLPAEATAGATTSPPPAAEGDLSEDFEGPLAADWNLASDEDATREISDGELHLVVNVESTLIWSSPDLTFDGDIVVDLDARQVEGPDFNNYGVLIHYQDSANYYEFDVSGDGMVAASKLVDGEYEPLLEWQVSDSVNKGNASNHLTIVTQGSRMDFYVNGDLVGSVTDTSHSDGGVAPVAGSFDDPGVHIAFDNVEVRASTVGATDDIGGATAPTPAPPPPTPTSAPPPPPPPTPTSVPPPAPDIPAGKGRLIMLNCRSDVVTVDVIPVAVFQELAPKTGPDCRPGEPIFLDPGEYILKASIAGVPSQGEATVTIVAGKTLQFSWN